MSSAATSSPPDAPSAPLPEPRIVHSDMPEPARKKCIELTLEALALHRIEKDQSMHVKQALEAWNGAMWMVVIGTAFGASVAHENHCMLMFSVGRVFCLCFSAFDEGVLTNTKKVPGGAAGAGGALGGGGGAKPAEEEEKADGGE